MNRTQDQIVTPALIKSAKKIFVSVIFNSDEQGWVEVTKKALLETLEFGIKRAIGDLDKSNNLWISRDYN